MFAAVGVCDVLERHSQQFLEASELLDKCVNEHAHQAGTSRSKGRKSRVSKCAKAKLQTVQDKVAPNISERALLQIHGLQAGLRESKPLQQRSADQTKFAEAR